MIIQETMRVITLAWKFMDFHVDTWKWGLFATVWIVMPEETRLSDEEWLVEINHDLRRKLGDVTVQINFDHTDLGADKTLI